MKPEGALLLVAIIFGIGSLVIGKSIVRWWHNLTYRETMLENILSIQRQTLYEAGKQINYTRAEREYLEAIKEGQTGLAKSIFEKQLAHLLFVHPDVLAKVKQ